MRVAAAGISNEREGPYTEVFPYVVVALLGYAQMAVQECNFFLVIVGASHQQKLAAICFAGRRKHHSLF